MPGIWLIFVIWIILIFNVTGFIRLSIKSITDILPLIRFIINIFFFLIGFYLIFFFNIFRFNFILSNLNKLIGFILIEHIIIIIFRLMIHQLFALLPCRGPLSCSLFWHSLSSS